MNSSMNTAPRIIGSLHMADASGAPTAGQGTRMGVGFASRTPSLTQRSKYRVLIANRFRILL